MTERQASLLRAVVRTLDSLTATGAENMRKILGCSDAIETILREYERPGRSARASQEGQTARWTGPGGGRGTATGEINGG